MQVAGYWPDEGARHCNTAIALNPNVALTNAAPRPFETLDTRPCLISDATRPVQPAISIGPDGIEHVVYNDGGTQNLGRSTHRCHHNWAFAKTRSCGKKEASRKNNTVLSSGAVHDRPDTKLESFARWV